jgi:hypothetical protein
VRSTLALVVLAAALAAPGATAKHTRVTLGVLGDPARFEQLTGQRSTTRLLIAGWDAHSLPQLLQTMGPSPMLGINSGSSPSPAQIARGAGDAFLVEVNNAIHGFAGTVYLRPLAEMNGYWNGYCAYDQNGTSRGPDFSTAVFKKAFARIALLARGDPGATAKLRALGLPPAPSGLRPNPNVLLVWNPQGYGSPDLPGNSADAYFPGNAYVDVVGDDLYDIRGKAEWPAAEKLYAAHPGKAFAFPEWGLWGIDAPSFVQQMASFAASHPRTTLISYYNGKPGSVFDLASKPASRAAYRRFILPLAR